MKPAHLEALISPLTGLSLRLQAIEVEEAGRIKEGTLEDASARHIVPIEITSRASSPTAIIAIVLANSGIVIARSKLTARTS